MTRPRVFVTRVLPDAGLDRVREACEVDLWEDELPPPREELLRRVAAKDGLLSLLTDRVDDELLDAAGPQLKVVSNFAVGFDNIDVPALTKRRIPGGNTPGVLTETTADLAFALLMAAARRIPESVDYVREGRWKTWGPMLLMGVDIHGATLGIVGFGRIGREMARRGRGFGMEILYHDVHPASAEDEADFGARRVEMDELLAASDFISLHVNLTDETHHLIDAEALRAMKPTAVLVNTSRGPVVDPVALEAALRANEIFAAGLDVTEPEPLPADHPLVGLSNCVVVPHIASASRVTRDRMAEMAAANLLAGLRGERLPNPINPEVYE
ncbi:MAG TPA: D-glycerate dehydrogenase [Candidatus Limnocylindria bacterium]